MVKAEASFETRKFHRIIQLFFRKQFSFTEKPQHFGKKSTHSKRSLSEVQHSGLVCRRVSRPLLDASEEKDRCWCSSCDSIYASAYDSYFWLATRSSSLTLLQIQRKFNLYCSISFTSFLMNRVINSIDLRLSGVTKFLFFTY